jgi:hypothetical protein
VINARACLGSHDILFITLDTLRYDVARQTLERGETPNLAALLPNRQWQQRHAPGSFTYASHHAFFAGFLPTPIAPATDPAAPRTSHERLFALEFPGSETIGEHTCLLDGPDIVTGLRRAGYHTICIGGVGFFNLQSQLGSVLPKLFDESHWRPELGVTDPESTRHQVALAVARVRAVPRGRRVMLFLNISAIHQPNYFYLDGAGEDSPATQAAALRYVDSQLPPLLSCMQRRAPVLAVICSDHGTAYGEDGFYGHRLAHPVVWTVPFAATTLLEIPV